MTFLPVLHPVLLLPLCAAGLGIAVWALVKARTAGARASWAVRILLVIAVAALAFRPGIPDGAARSVATDVDIVIAVDNTTSMYADDWSGADQEDQDAAAGGLRMDGVKDDVRALIQAYPGARFALIAFDNSAQLRLPLTTDSSALVASLDVMSPPPTDRASGSSIGIAAELLQETLENAQSGADGRARLVFYLGDGEQTVDSDPESFAGSGDLVDGGGVLGYGTSDGGRMLHVGGGVDEADAGDYIQDPEGGPALSVTDEAALQTIADDLGVEYQHRTGDTEPTFPEVPAETTTLADVETPGARQELSWIIALGVAGLVMVEIAIAATRIGRTLALGGRSRPGRPKEGA